MGRLVVRFLRLVIRNDAMRRDPPDIYGWRVFALACAWLGDYLKAQIADASLRYSFGGMLFGWDMGAIGGITMMDEFRKDYNVGPSESYYLTENVVSTLQAGCFIASLVACPFADKYGRRWPLIASALVACVGVGLQAAQTGSLPMMYLGRLVAGFGVGAASMLTPLLFIVNGVMISFCPRYTAKNGDWAKTAAILSQLMRLPPDHPYLQKELRQMADQLEVERRLVGDATAWTLLKEMWTIRPNRERALTSIALMVCQQLTGVNAINYYAPQIFHAMGVYGVENSLLATGVYGIVKVVACAAFLVFAADSLGRRLSLLWTSVAQAACMFVVGAYVYSSKPGERLPGAKGPLLTPGLPDKRGIPPFGYVAIVSVYLFAASAGDPAVGSTSDTPSEIPSTRLRAMNVAQAAATQWLFNFIIARTAPTMMTRMGKDGYGTFFLFGAFSLAMAPFTYRLIPETKGRRLEEMDKLFGITEVQEAMERLHGRNNGNNDNSNNTTVAATPTTETAMYLPRMTNATVDTTTAMKTTQPGIQPYSNDTDDAATGSFLPRASPLSSSSTARPDN
ncbi:hypothetical protein DL766_001583 [Monosporascus sp. MC13-8B]|uniref:Major facilitator superfamily (MFS) profile domain-containing protein n=1 Tax=Monosporascus cannonballus TaxID=155416 RepID=A0ABY0HIX2_9PEZI|nr:hypothetical protein DL763_006584 [Monosporascus cannonballus]RYO94483.1 hypothetical protein DL762_000579 [Monosporascus cannonballus]RYP37273.1 hypothetical protein DL766_001583 [Monosporascus sp. MC13-8B]